MAEQPVVATAEGSRGMPEVRRARNWRRVGLALIALAVGLGLTGLLGVRSATVTDRAPGGWVLEVRHAQVTRAGVAVPFHVTVRRPGGFEEPVTLSISASLLERFDFQNFYPNPSAETATGDRVVYEFDPPPGDTFRLSLDARTAPDQNGSTGVYETALLVGDLPVAEVSFRMWVVP